MVLDKAEHDNYYKYAIYTSRSLMVKHPEIYLQADGLFLQTIQANNGFKQTYETNDVHSEGVRNGMDGPPFSFDQVDFSKYKIIRPVEIYPEGYPVLSYTDRRLLSAASTLKPVDERVTQLAKAVQYYFVLKEQAPSDQIYLIYCDNENTYLYHQGDLIFATDLQKAEQIEGNPILIFNEERVWYPLMDRNDASKDATLERIVAEYTTDIITPELSDFEAGLVSHFAKVTSLEDHQINFALVAAAKSSNTAQLQNRPFSTIWRQLPLYPGPSLLRQLLKNANLLSPMVAYLSSIAEEHEGEAKIEAICAEHLKHAATPGWSEAHGHLWMLGIIEYTVEDSYYTHAGQCLAQAATMQAVLDIAGIDNYRIQSFILEPGLFGHDYIYIPEYDVIVDNGRFNKTAPVYHKSVLCYIQGGWPLEIMEFLAHDDKWACLQHAPQYSGTLSPPEAIEILNHLKSIHGDNLKGQVWYPQALRKAISFEELISELERQQGCWTPLMLP
ncbi:MAG: hypothetical protein PHQ43_05875 [Dehalococcoidales bacterium]|nr:hypothetical protein [Dehalococcoidales bacterium]